MELIINSPDTITIKGHIISLDHYIDIKQAIQKNIQIHNLQSLILNIPDSNTITSSMIGFFIKLVNADRINLSMRVGQANLFTMLEELNLVALFNVQKL